MARKTIPVGHLVIPINGMEKYLTQVPLIIIDQDGPYYKTKAYLRNQRAMTYADTKFFQDLGLASKLEHIIYGVPYDP